MTDSVLATLRDRDSHPERQEVLISAPIPMATQVYPLDVDEPPTPTNAHMTADLDKDHLTIPAGSDGLSPKPSLPGSSDTGETLVDPPLPPLRPSWVRLYSVTTPRERLSCLIPAVLFAIGSAMVAPYMTVLIGDAFSGLAAFWFSKKTDDDHAVMMRIERDVTLKIVILAIVSFVLTYLKNALWVTYGELTANRLRRMMYDGVLEKPMEWYDMGMGTTEPDQSGAVGAGGLMGKFAR